jgi:hypothetical protein
VLPDFTNILCAAFMCVDPQIAKMTVKSSVIFVLLVSMHVKAEHKHVSEIEPLLGSVFYQANLSLTWKITSDAKGMHFAKFWNFF